MREKVNSYWGSCGSASSAVVQRICHPLPPLSARDPVCIIGGLPPSPAAAFDGTLGKV